MGSTVLWGSELAKSLNRQRDDELYHFGIKGMKWGVRRFQRKDGTRTKAGKKRERDTWRGRDAKNISDEELRKRIQRLQTEQNYKRLMESDARRTMRQIGQNVTSTAAGKIIGTMAAGAGLYATKKAFDKFGRGDMFDSIYEFGKGKDKKGKGGK